MPANKNKKKHLNLLPKNQFDASLLGRILKWTLSTFRVLVIFVELIVISGFLMRFYLDIQHTDLNDEIEQKTAIIESYSSFEKDFKETQTRLALWESMASPENNFGLLFDKISKSIPQDVELNDLKKVDQTIEIKASTLNEAAVNQFVANLKAYPELSTISVVSIETQKDSPLIIVTLKTQNAS